MKRNPKFFGALYGGETSQKGRDYSRSFEPEVDERLRQILNAPAPPPKHPEVMGGDFLNNLPSLPPTPAALRPDPLIIGDPDFAATAHGMFQKYPELRLKLDKVQKGLSQEFIKSYGRTHHPRGSQIPIDYQGMTSLQGQYRNPDYGDPQRSITVSPGIIPEDNYDVLLHEAAHAQGARHNTPETDTANEITDLLEEFYRRKTLRDMRENPTIAYDTQGKPIGRIRR